MSAIITFVYPIIRRDYISKSIETLLKFTDKSKFKLIVVDQSIEGLPDMYDVDMVIRMKNQGFAAAANTGLRVGLSWDTQYLGVINDDTEFIYPTWLEDALEEFENDPRIMAVNPMCPKIAMWGYGHTEGEYLEILPYKEIYTPQDIVYLKREDYDMMARIYSCAWPIPREECNPEFHGRAVATMKSWVWHHWGKSKDTPLDPRLFEAREQWNRLDLLWTPTSDPWGHTEGKPNKRIPEVYVHTP